jgi:hypothetical protein
MRAGQGCGGSILRGEHVGGSLREWFDWMDGNFSLISKRVLFDYVVRVISGRVIRVG